RYPRRFAAGLLATTGVLGLVLAIAGLYGVMSYSVAERVHEIGVRMALGAGRRDILRLVVVEGVRVTLVGCVVGLVLGYAALRVVSSTVVALPSVDAASMAILPLAILAVVVAACYIPARRAARVDP